jgi:hypothetical protein
MMKQLIKGIVTFVPGAYRALSRKRSDGTDSARYCYSVWLRHVVMAHHNGLSTCPRVAAELGPGDSIGIGLAALLSGVDKYYAFDIVEYADVGRNVAIFDDLIALFAGKEDIPGDDEFPRVEPKLDCYAFPNDVLTDERLRAALEPGRLKMIRASILDMNRPGSVVQYKVPWYDSTIVEEDSLDMIFSQAVLEHVDEIKLTYGKMHTWLKPNGVMSHAIDFKSHDSADEWNGHWAYGDSVWKIVRGKRPYLINRLPHSHHIDLIHKNGFKIVCDITTQIPSNIAIDNVAPRFREMKDEDLITGSAFIQAVKLPPA